MQIYDRYLNVYITFTKKRIKIWRLISTETLDKTTEYIV